MHKPGSRAVTVPSEADVSRSRQERTREQVIGPLVQRGRENEFAALIRASLIQPHRRQP